jgi:hypothetical protein
MAASWSRSRTWTTNWWPSHRDPAVPARPRQAGRRVQGQREVTLLTGTEKQEVELKPAGDKLEATGSFKVGPGTKAVAVVTVGGKPATARFTVK